MPFAAACIISAISFTPTSSTFPAAFPAYLNALPHSGPEAPPQYSIIISEELTRNSPIFPFLRVAQSFFNCLKPFAILIPKSPSPFLSASQKATSLAIIISAILSTKTVNPAVFIFSPITGLPLTSYVAAFSTFSAFLATGVVASTFAGTVPNTFARASIASSQAFARALAPHVIAGVATG